MTGNLASIYGNRHDMVSMLKSASAPGRPAMTFGSAKSLRVTMASTRKAKMKVGRIKGKVMRTSVRQGLEPLS